MSLTERERETRRIYDERPYEWLDVSGGRDRNFWQGEMKFFMKNLGRGKSIIELGCGPATDGKWLLEAGCRNVTSIDYSFGMLKMAQDVLGGACKKPVLARMDMYELGFPKNTFDGFWASASLLHLEEPWDALREISRVLKSGGLGFVSVKEGTGEKVNPKTGYYFKYYSRAQFSFLLRGAGFYILDSRIRENQNHNWLTFFVQKPGWQKSTRLL